MSRSLFAWLAGLLIGLSCCPAAEPAAKDVVRGEVLEAQPQGAVLWRKNGTQSRIQLLHLTTEELRFTLTDNMVPLRYTPSSPNVLGIQTAGGDHYAVNPASGQFDRFDPKTKTFGVPGKAAQAKLEAEQTKRAAEAKALQDAEQAKRAAEAKVLQGAEKVQRAAEKAKLEAEQAQQAAAKAQMEAEQSQRAAEAEAQQAAHQAKREAEILAEKLALSIKYAGEQGGPEPGRERSPQTAPSNRSSEKLRSATGEATARPAAPSTIENVVQGVGIVLAAVAVGALLILGYGFQTRCPQCRKWWARQTEDTEVLGRQQGYATVTRYDTHRDAERQVLGQTERQEQVHVVRVLCRDHYACRSCAHRWTADYAQQYEG